MTLGHYQQNFRLHQPYPDARSAERWDVKLVKGLLPRHMQIIKKLILALKRWWRKPGRAMKKLGQTGGGARQTSAYGEPVCGGGFAVNGVAALHSDLVVKDLSRNITSYGRTNSITSPTVLPTSLDQTVQPGTGGSVG